jgi:hypothetical protein
MFKPFFTGVNTSHESLVISPGPRPDDSYWWRWEQWHREALCNYRNAKRAWSEKAFPTEETWLAAWARNDFPMHAAVTLSQASEDAVQTSFKILGDMLKTLRRHPGKSPGLLYRHTWRRWNRKAGLGAFCPRRGDPLGC